MMEMTIGQPPQEQTKQPGLEHEMTPAPEYILPNYTGAKLLSGKCALITGGDSGIGRAVAVAFACEGADVAFIYLDEDADAKETCALIEAEGQRALAITGDVGDESFCRDAVREMLAVLGRIDILVNNAAEQHTRSDIREITETQLVKTFRTNIFSMFFLVQATLDHLAPGSTIINTTSVTAYRGNADLVDYATTKGAIVAFTRSLALQLVEKKIRVNAVAPGPIWTPLIPATMSAEDVAEHGSTAPMHRAGQPSEVAPAYVYLASDRSSYMSGQTLHLNGGIIVNG